MIKAILFDLDGVLADTERVHYYALIQAIRELTGLEDVVSGDGTSTKYKLQGLQVEYHLTDRCIAEIDKRKQELTLAQLEVAEHDPAKTEMLGHLYDAGYLLGLVSNSRSENVHCILDKMDAFRFFDIVVSPSPSLAPKPAPDMYTHAMKELDVKPRESLIIEDSEAGILSAIKSGAHFLAIDNIGQVTQENIENAINTANNCGPNGGKGRALFVRRLQRH